MPLREQIARRVVRMPNGCLIWTGYRRNGYGRVRITDNGKHRQHDVHILVWEDEHGPVPDGMQLDHTCHSNDATCQGGLCEHRACCEITHLEPVLPVQNSHRGRGNASKTHCKHGHRFDEQNTYLTTQRQRNPARRARYRQCRTCHRLAERRRKQRVRSAAAAR